MKKMNVQQGNFSLIKCSSLFNSISMINKVSNRPHDPKINIEKSRPKISQADLNASKHITNKRGHMNREGNEVDNKRQNVEVINTKKMNRGDAAMMAADNDVPANIGRKRIYLGQRKDFINNG